MKKSDTSIEWKEKEEDNPKIYTRLRKERESTKTEKMKKIVLAMVIQLVASRCENTGYFLSFILYFGISELIIYSDKSWLKFCLKS